MLQCEYILLKSTSLQSRPFLTIIIQGWWFNLCMYFIYVAFTTPGNLWIPQSAVNVDDNNILMQPAGISVSQGNRKLVQGHPVKFHSKVSNSGVAGLQYQVLKTITASWPVIFLQSAWWRMQSWECQAHGASVGGNHLLKPGVWFWSILTVS